MNATEGRLVSFQVPWGVWLERVSLEDEGSGLPSTGVPQEDFPQWGSTSLKHTHVQAYVPTGIQAHVHVHTGTDTYTCTRPEAYAHMYTSI